MLPQHHLPQLIPNRIGQFLERLRAQIWLEPLPLEVETTSFGPTQKTYEDAIRLPLVKVKVGSSWGKLFDQRWCKIIFPKRDGFIWLNWRDQGEATLYVEGLPYYGFDVAHRYCKLPQNIGEAWIEANCIQSAIWHPDAPGLKEGSLFEGAFLCRRNEKAWKAYHDLKCLFDLAMDQRCRENPQLSTNLNSFGLQPVVDKFSPVYRRLLRFMNDAVDDYEVKGWEGMEARLKEAYGMLRMDEKIMRCVLTGHGHIDLVWLWPERMGELKAVHTFATMNRLMEEYPEFRFSYSQIASYHAVRRRSPGLFEKVQKRIASGQWQATGAMYVESDTMLACGEALARGFFLGQKGFKEINGRFSPLTWLPDVFGYSGCLPQIMKQFGVDYFFTTKMTWNAVNRFPHSSFIWRGTDGSEILAHVTQDCGYNAVVDVAEVKASMNAHQQGDIHAEYLLPTGYGDGGGGTTAEMCERARRLSALPGMPTIAWDQPEDFFDRLNKIKKHLPVHQGECYLEYHRGTFTTHGELKAAFRDLERSLFVAEAIACATDLRWNMEHSWERLIFAQFHDYVPGSSVWDVYLEGVPELRALALAEKTKAVEILETFGSGKFCLFNPHALPVNCWTEDPRTGEDIYVSLPALGGRKLENVRLKQAPPPVKTGERTVSNGLVEFHLDGKGWIDRLVFNGRPILLHKPIGQLFLYPDCASKFDAWDIDRHVLSLGQLCDAQAGIKPVSRGMRGGGISVSRKIGKASRATVTYSLEPGSEVLDITTDLEWNEPEHLLKILFPTDYAGVNARFGSPFGSVLRSQISDGNVSDAKWEVPFSRYLAVFDEGERDGLFLITESKYGAYAKDGTIGLSLVRSPKVAGFDTHQGAWPSELSRIEIPSQFSDIGKHQIRLALGYYDSTLPREKSPSALAETHFTKPISYKGIEILSPLRSLKGGDSLIPVWAKPVEEGGWILRLHEVAGCHGEIEIDFDQDWEIGTTDLGEATMKKLRRNRVNFSPYQIVSILFRKKE